MPFCTNLRWHDVPLVDLLRAQIDKPIFVGNDATVAALAESVSGACRGVRDSVVITLGTGVGGGVIIDGKLFTGPHGVATEVGHMIIVAGGEMCTCGNRGCWERYASASAIIREGRKLAGAKPIARSPARWRAIWTGSRRAASSTSRARATGLRQNL